MGIVAAGPNYFPITVRIACIGLAVTMIYLLHHVGEHAPMGDRIIVAILSLTILLLLLIPPLRGLFLWPVRCAVDTDHQIITTTTIIGHATSLPFSAVRGMQPRSFWHGGRSSFEGLILHLNNGKRITLSNGNLHSVQHIREVLGQAGIHDVGGTIKGGPLKG
ncbi:MAG: hypothetical protein IT230_02665 [Flavobacteriales bacterium]|nr:hypothetical protein [Flavobacteriales bacterium]